jgi:hypothetical protein
VFKHFSLGPVLSRYLDAASATEPLQQSRWQYGVVSAAKAFEQPRSAYGAIQVFIASGTGVAAAVTLAGLPLVVQFLIGGIAGLAVYWGVPTVWAGVAALPAPVIQRDRARQYARALESYAKDYAQWAARLQLAYDFRHDTLEDVRRISAGNLMGSVADEKTRWRGILTNFGGQIEANGGSVSDLVESQLAFLDDPEVLHNTFAGDEIARIRNSMLPACQNPLAMIRSEGPPTPPTPPRAKATGPAFQ